ncbi:MAG: protease pro-enzyme activation domain-containing protein, partial [Trebonia sp.]
MPDLVPLPGSERSRLQGAAPAPAPLDKSQVITVTVLLRRRAEVPRELVEGPQAISAGELGARFGADPGDARLVGEVLGDYGLTVAETHLESRRLKVSGAITAMESAFGTSLDAVTSPHPDGSGDVRHRYRTGGLSVSARLEGIVTGVLGLDDRPQAHPQFRRPPALRSRTTAEPDDDGTSDPGRTRKPAPQGSAL